MIARKFVCSFKRLHLYYCVVWPNPNGVIQENSMDVCMHFWDVRPHQVCTRYFSPEFILSRCCRRATKLILWIVFAIFVWQSFHEYQRMAEWQVVFFVIFMRMKMISIIQSLLKLVLSGRHVAQGAFQTVDRIVGWKLNDNLSCMC